LPVERAEPHQKPTTWNARRGVVAAFLVIAAILAGIVVAVRLTEPKPIPFDLAAEHSALEKGLEELTPAEAWERWAYLYSHLAERGLEPPPVRLSAAEVKELERKRFLQKALLAPTGLSLTIAVLVALWPGGKRARQVDNRP
jgi:hypothetical protein